MPPRRSHKKSRNGCDQCKKRRVKCDEADPCLNCTRRSLSCSYQHRIGTPQPEPKTKHAERLVACTPAPGTSLAKISARTDAALSVFQRNLTDTAYFGREWNGQDPELMHHYCTSTCTTLSDREDIHHVWRIEVPKIAYSYEFLMHGILSLSALHLSYVKPEKHSHYLTSSTFHMALGLQTFRTILRKPTAENCFALFAFSSVIMVWICGVPTDSKDAQPLSSVIEMFNLSRGITSLLEFFPLIQKSCLGPLFSQDWSEKVDTPLRLFHGLNDQIHRLRYRLTVEVLEEEERSILEHAIIELKKACQRIERAHSPSACGLIFIWPITVRNGFISLIEKRQPFALVLLACYCAQLHVFRRFWVMESRAESLLSEVLAVMPPGYADLLDWPRQFCLHGPDMERWCVLHPSMEGVAQETFSHVYI
ncbi:hypothetical protein BDV32DRAFT_133503 [Aspergillus pseudonomiae]|uniref:Uncharacterized protein n=1 Tax=Aspergillus pseudonomiae TaxID=1506151 RepID=A0A5N6HJ77_9EURO|nr:uncharacterized protein BDV37DRAFT_246349 [Aspergillus pseudonomiae]KAB8253779.1 hypothetical protein BDV32DRAFT_133503 [Aspergillus pseudonomiae]KAE8405092.1 hypothetical protein BDV37DRAFT_246349 [Aspergillus pseudonomiae]